MCEYCEKSKSLFYDRRSKDVREVVVELDGSLSISSNHYDFNEEEKYESIGFSIDEAIKMSQFSYNIEIKYCPMCGKKLMHEGEPMENKLSEKLKHCLDGGGCGKCDCYEAKSVLTCRRLLEKAYEEIKKNEEVEEQHKNG